MNFILLAEAKMEATRAIQILVAHGVQWRRAGEWLEIESMWVRGGFYGSEWIECPRGQRELLVWLGY